MHPLCVRMTRADPAINTISVEIRARVAESKQFRFAELIYIYRFQRADFCRVEVKCHREMNARSNKTIQMYRSIGKLKFRRSSYEACIVRDISCNRNCRCKLSVKFITTYNQTLRAINHEGLRTSCITSIERVFIKNNFRQFRQEYSKNRTAKSIN